MMELSGAVSSSSEALPRASIAWRICRRPRSPAVMLLPVIPFNPPPDSWRRLRTFPI